MDKKRKRDEIFAKTIMGLTGAFCGFFIMISMDLDALFSKTPGGLLFAVAGAMVLVGLAMFLHSVVHETGHLVFGLLTGYKFVSFRIGSIMLIKESGKLRLKLYNIVGTGGQCLMMPPPWRDSMPYRLYNLGGCIFNLVFGFAFLPLCFAAEHGSLLSVASMIFFVVGIANAVLNGVPLQTGGISNDGRNALLLGKSETSLRAFWLQLYVNGLISNGERMKNMPGEWFFMPEGEGCGDPIICTVGVFRYNYFFDTHDFAAAEDTAVKMLGMPGLLGLHRNELLCELVFLRVLRGADSSEIDPLLTPQLKKYMRATASYVSRKRLAYAYQLLYKRDYALAEKCLLEFERAVKSYPYSSEIENEKEIMEIVKERAEHI